MEPASKVSVPLTVVMRTRSRTPERDLYPALVVVNVLPLSLYITPHAIQLFEDMFAKTMLPSKLLVACPDKIPNPVAKLLLETVVSIFELPDEYDVVDTDPAPI